MAKQWHRYARIGLVIVTLLLVGGKLWGDSSSRRVRAAVSAIETWQTRCVALDIVFVVDQSSSMKWNDPLKNRIYAVQVAMDWLVTNRLGMCPQVVHRVGIVSFGEKPEVDLPMTPLDVDSEEAWKKKKEELLRNFGPKDLVATDQWAALKKAKALLDSAGYLAGPYPRKRAIILLTDGWPCVAALGCSAQHDAMDKEAYMRDFQAWAAENLYFAPKLLARERALNALAARYAPKSVPAQEINQVLAEYPVSNEDLWKSVYVWVIAMNDKTDYLKVVGDYLRAIASSHGGTLFDLKENRSDVPVEFDRVLSRLLNIQPERQQCGDLYVDPYLEALVINVYKNAEGVKVKISSGGYALEGGKDAGSRSGAESYFAKKVVYTSNGAHNEHYTFVLPHPGKWKISSTVCNAFQALVLPLDPAVSSSDGAWSFPLYRPKGNERYDPQHPFYLHFPILHSSKLVKEFMGASHLPPLVDEGTCQWEDQNGTLQTSDCGLKIWAYIRDPKGQEVKTPMKFIPSSKEWQTTQPIPVDVAGTYHVQIEAKAHCLGDEAAQKGKAYCQNGEYVVIPKEALSLTYHVANTVAFHLEVAMPRGTVGAHQSLWPDKLKPMPLVVQVKAVDERGNTLPIAQIFPAGGKALQANVQVGDEQREVTLHASAGGKAMVGTIDDWGVTGEGNVKVVITGDYDYAHYQPVSMAVTAAFVRRDPLWRSPLTYEIIAVLLALLMAGWIVYLVYMHTHTVYGRLIFEGGADAREFSVPLPPRRFSSPKMPVQLRGVALKAWLDAGGKFLKAEVKERGKAKRVVTIKETPSVTIGGYRVRWDSGGRRRSTGRHTVSRSTRPRRRHRS